MKKFDDNILCKNDSTLSKQFILCLRRAEYLQDIEGYPILADLFRGFGDTLVSLYIFYNATT